MTELELRPRVFLVFIILNKIFFTILNKCVSFAIVHSFEFLDLFFYEWFSSVAQLCLILCDPMNCSTPGLPVHHQLLEFTQTHLHWISDATVVPFSSCPQSSPASGFFQMSQLYTWGGQSIGVSTSTSVLPINTQDWFPSGWTGWISLQSKGLSRVFSNTTLQKCQFFCTQLSL